MTQVQVIECFDKAAKMEKTIPAILYKDNSSSIPFKISSDLIFKLMHDGAITTKQIVLEISNKKYAALVKEIQLNPINEQPMHVDFMPIIEGKNQVAAVPFVILNRETSVGVKRGGVMFTLRRYIKLRGDLSKLPRLITYDATKLNIGNKIYVRDLDQVKGFDFVDRADTLLINLSGKKKKVTEEEESNDTETA